MGKTSGTTRTVSSTGPPEFQQPQFEQQVSEAQRLYQQPGPQFYPGSTVAPFAGAETAGQQYLESIAGPLATYFQDQFQPFLQSQFQSAGQFLPPLFNAAGTVSGLTQPQGPGFDVSALRQLIPGQTQGFGTNALNYALQLPQNIGTDPTVQAAIQGATAPIFRQLTESVLPNIRNEAVASGTYGGSPQSLAEAQAVERTTRGAQEVGAVIMNQAFLNSLNNQLQAVNIGQNLNLADASRLTNANLAIAGMEQGGNIADVNRRQSGQQFLSSLYGNLFGSGTQAGLSAAGLSPILSQGLTAPGQILTGVGGQQRSMEQANLDEAIQRFNYEQQLPYQKLIEYANLIRGPFGGTSTTEVQGTPPGGAAQGLSLALTGLGIAPQIIDAIRKIIGLF